MQTGNGQTFPKYRATADVYALKLHSVTVNPDNGKTTFIFADSYYHPLELPLGEIDGHVSAAAGGLTAESYLVVEGDRKLIMPAARFEAHFKRVD
ncbi:hypothetical protein ACVWW6_005546 [Bradyrhizobium sp. USDA 3311]